MYKTEFYNKKFYWFVVIAVSAIFLRTIYTVFSKNQGYLIEPMILQFLLLVLIIAKHRYARISIIIWVILFLLIFSAFQFAKQLVQNFRYGFDYTHLMFYFEVSINIIVGSLILFYTIKTTKVTREVKKADC